MKIIVDAFGGDNAPNEIILGCVQSKAELGTEIILSGNREKILAAAKEINCFDEVSAWQILDCDDEITMDDEATSVVKEKKNSSMAVGLQALADGVGDAFASAGNSGALVVGATMIVKRIRKVKRVSFAPIIPKYNGFLMFSDAGANIECRPEMLLQFGIMGSVYMEKVMGIKNPRVGLANVGTEEHKGDELRHESYKLLKKCTDINFVGNVEAREIPYDAADVVVSDGFTGNIIIKLFEGVAMVVMDKFKEVLTKNFKNKLAAAVVYSDMKELKKTMDYNAYGGAPIMGAAKPVFKIHGSAKANTVQSALKLTRDYAESGIIEEIAKAVSGKDRQIGSAE